MLVGQTIGKDPHRFEIEQELGSGAMGTVYRAKFHQDGKVSSVALKIIALGLLGNEGAMARFEREANILKQLRHPHIVKLHATGAWRKTPFIAMEFIDGEALDRILARRGKLTWEEVLAYGKQLCEALQYAHEKGIIHRDLKPSNLMITTEGILKLTDFGIAKDTDVTALTGQNSTIGTAAYMSPEQCKGDKNLTNKSDLYSLGIVFYELLTGKKPFYADTTVDMFLKHVNEPAPRLGKLVNDLPAKFESLILQLMEKDKDDRPTDAAWIVRMLNEVEEDVFTRRSAGLLAATSKRQNKSRNLDGSRLDDDDREAARALRGKKKKKKKEAEIPFLERTWVKATGLVLALVVLVGGAYLALKPSSPEKLVAAIDSASTVEAKLEAATKYLEKYGDQPGDMTDRAAAAYRDGKVRERERALATRFGRNLSNPTETDDKDAYRYTWEALEAESAGNLAQAEERWRRVKERFPEEGKLPFTLKDDALFKARWGWLADKRIADLGRARNEYVAARKKIDESRRHDLPFNLDPTSPEGMAIKAMRLEDMGDKEKAARTWSQLADLTKDEPDRRPWQLLALQQRAIATLGKPIEETTAMALRISKIQGKVDEATAIADGIRENDPEENKKRADVRLRCREVIDLYDEDARLQNADPKLVGLVKKANDLAAKYAKR